MFALRFGHFGGFAKDPCDQGPFKSCIPQFRMAVVLCGSAEAQPWGRGSATVSLQPDHATETAQLCCLPEAAWREGLLLATGQAGSQARGHGQQPVPGQQGQTQGVRALASFIVGPGIVSYVIYATFQAVQKEGMGSGSACCSPSCRHTGKVMCTSPAQTVSASGSLF